MPAVKLYGLSAAEVINPDGEVVSYLITEVPARGGEWRAWSLVKPDGTAYRVAEVPGDAAGWRCLCPDFAHRFRRCRTRPAGSGCKHLDSLWDFLAEADDGATGGRGAVHAGGGGAAAEDGRVHAEAAGPGGAVPAADPDEPRHLGVDGRGHPGAPVPGGQPAPVPPAAGAGRGRRRRRGASPEEKIPGSTRVTGGQPRPTSGQLSAGAG